MTLLDRSQIRIYSERYFSRHESLSIGQTSLRTPTGLSFFGDVLCISMMDKTNFHIFTTFIQFYPKKNKFLVLPDPHPTPSLFFLGLIFSNVIAWVCFLLFGGVAYFGLSLSLWNCNEKLLLLRLGKIQLATLAFSEKDSKGRSGGRVCMLGSGSQPFWAKYNSSEQKNCLLKRFGPDFCQRLGLVTHCCWVYIFDTVFG